jgi:signal transduction histidine kinase
MNSQKEQPKVDIEIYIVFMILIGISVFNAIYCSVKIEKNQEITTHVIAVETPSIEELGELNELVTRSRMLSTNWVYLPFNSDDKIKLKELLTRDYPQSKREIARLMKRWTDIHNIPKINKSFLQIESLINSEMELANSLRSFSDYEDPMKKFAAEESIENIILPRSMLISKELNAIIASKQAELEVLHSVMQVSYRNLIWSVLAVAMGIIMVVLLAAFYLSHFMILPVMKLKGYIRQLGKGEVPVIEMQIKNNAVGQMTEAVIALTESFKTTAQFAFEIGEGKFDTQYAMRSDEDELGNALIQMRDKLCRAQYELTEYMQQLQLQNDILHQARQDLFEKARELELADKYKSEFLANMSHELRTPLNSILILAKILCENRNDVLTEKELEYTKIIHRSGSDLLLLINDILDLSKIEAGRIELIYDNVRIDELKSESFTLFDEIAKEKKINFGIEISSGVPEFIVADKLRLSQVIRNLLSNAFKFTEAKGEIYLRFRIGLRMSKLFLEISVQDTGIGIPEEKQSMIFEAFQQADGSISRKYGGTGLGLSISRMLVGLMGGALSLTSKEGAGSTFYVYLPLTPDAALEKSTEKEKNANERIAGQDKSQVSIK